MDMQLLISQLSAAIGPEKAIPIDRLALSAGVCRREMEMTLEASIGDIPFCLVAGPRGFFRPTEAEQINAYLRTLHSRHRRLQVRENRVRRRARLDGWNLNHTETRFSTASSQAVFEFDAPSLHPSRCTS
jgi:hypothetical protein